MAFQQFTRSQNGPTSSPTIGVDNRGFITISTAAHQLLGAPTAVIVEWDPEDYLIRLTGADPDNRNAFRTGGKNPAKRFAATAFLEQAGLGIPEKAQKFTATKTGARSIVADFSDLPAAKAHASGRRTA